MLEKNFAHIDTWVFDLDNTLYPPEAGLFALMDVRFAAYVGRVTGLPPEEALRLSIRYWESYGSTLIGLMKDFDVDPHEFLDHVHDIDISHLKPCDLLITAISALPGRCIVYTNGSQNHAKRVIAARGLSQAFDAVYGVEDAEFQPKPNEGAFRTVFANDGVIPTQSAMFEDEPRNLAVPHEMGMRTVHVHPQRKDAAHIHHHTDDLAAFLSQVVR